MANKQRTGVQQGRTSFLLTGHDKLPARPSFISTFGAVHPQPRRALKISPGQARDDSYLEEATCPASQVRRRSA